MLKRHSILPAKNCVPFLNLAFRPLFLLPAIFSTIALALWLGLLSGNITWVGVLPANIWHGHEMLFGFAVSVAIGFLLTAAQTWTGVSSISGFNLACLVLLWVLARIFLAGSNASWLIAGLVCESAFWLFSIAKLGHMILSSGNQRNIIFIFLLFVMSVIDLASIMLAIKGDILSASHMLYTAVLMMTCIITVLGGRVIPFFTTRALNLPAVTASEKIEKVTFVLMAAAILLYASKPWHDQQTALGIAFIGLGSLHIARLCQWYVLQTFRTPLLWSLHLSYLNMALGFILIGVSYFSLIVTFSLAMHVITVGTIGLMIIAMMARVSLGHTGRPLVISKLVSFAFVLLMLATLARVLIPLAGAFMLGISLATAMWVIGFFIFVYVYTPILLNARPDGRGG